MDTPLNPIPTTPAPMISGENFAVDQAQLRAFTGGAKYRTGNDPMPWSQFDQEEVARYNVSLRLNDYYLSMLRYISKQQGISQQKFMATIILPALEQELEKLKNSRSF